MRRLRGLADYHHSGAARGQALVLSHRLGHELYFPNSKFCESISSFCPPNVWLPCAENWLDHLGGVPDSLNAQYKSGVYTISRDEFNAMDWDFILCTRIESQDIFKRLIAEHPKKINPYIIGMTGNEAGLWDWAWMKNFMSSDYLSYVRAPDDINKVWYSQEMGWQYGQEFVPIDETSLKTVNCFINCWRSFTHFWHWESETSYWGGLCPHCDGQRREQPAVAPYTIWDEARKSMPDYHFAEYGIDCDHGCLPETELPAAYNSGALTVHLKTYDGYGFSLLQSVAMGRPVLVPRRFHRYRTANKYLIPNLTCFEVEWNANSLMDTIRYVTGNLDRANAYAWACFQAARHLFNWNIETMRVGEFLDRLKK